MKLFHVTTVTAVTTGPDYVKGVVSDYVADKVDLFKNGFAWFDRVGGFVSEHLDIDVDDVMENPAISDFVKAFDEVKDGYHAHIAPLLSRDDVRDAENVNDDEATHKEDLAILNSMTDKELMDAFELTRAELIAYGYEIDPVYNSRQRRNAGIAKTLLKTGSKMLKNAKHGMKKSLEPLTPNLRQVHVRVKNHLKRQSDRAVGGLASGIGRNAGNIAVKLSSANKILLRRIRDAKRALQKLNTKIPVDSRWSAKKTKKFLTAVGVQFAISGTVAGVTELSKMLYDHVTERNAAAVSEGKVAPYTPELVQMFADDCGDDVAHYHNSAGVKFYHADALIFDEQGLQSDEQLDLAKKELESDYNDNDAEYMSVLDIYELVEIARRSGHIPSRRRRSVDDCFPSLSFVSIDDFNDWLASSPPCLNSHSQFVSQLINDGDVSAAAAVQLDWDTRIIEQVKSTFLASRFDIATLDVPSVKILLAERIGPDAVAELDSILPKPFPVTPFYFLAAILFFVFSLCVKIIC